jgi:hypothetical protein
MRRGMIDMRSRKRRIVKVTKKWSLEQIVAFVVLEFLLAVAVWAELSAETWRVPARWGEPSDSTQMLFYKNGVQSVTAKRTGTQSYDTTFTVNHDTFYSAEFRIYYHGVDSAATWVWERFTSAQSGSGAGSEQVRIFALDTSGFDAAIQGVKITVRNAAGQLVAAQYTGGNGSAAFYLDQASGASRYSMYGSKSGDVFPSDTFSVTGPCDSLPLKGYDIAVNAAPNPSPNTSQVYGYIFDVTGKAMVDAQVVFSLTKAVNNICDSTIMGNFTATAVTDSTGLFQQDLIYSSCLTGAPQYQVVVTYKGVRSRAKLFSVPDSPTYELEWWQ